MCHLVRSGMYQHVPYETKQDFNNLNLEMSVYARVHAQLSNLHCSRTPLKIPNGGNNWKTVICIGIATIKVLS